MTEKESNDRYLRALFGDLLSRNLPESSRQYFLNQQPQHTEHPSNELRQLRAPVEGPQRATAAGGASPDETQRRLSDKRREFEMDLDNGGSNDFLRLPY